MILEFESGLISFFELRSDPATELQFLEILVTLIYNSRPDQFNQLSRHVKSKIEHSTREEKHCVRDGVLREGEEPFFRQHSRYGAKIRQ